MPRLLILTLDSGEAALPILREQLAAQTFRDFEHELISGLPNQAAHNTLYRRIMARAGSFDLFLKLDADMTLRSETSLADMIAAIEPRADVQHFAFKVWDSFTEEATLGVHLFRTGVSWGDITDDLFVDPDPPGVKQLLWDGPPAPFVDHGRFASDFECFAFGVHKFLKVAQRGSGRMPKAHKYFRHMNNCARIRDLCRQTQARRHQLALAGVLWAMRHDRVAAVADKSELRSIFEKEILADDSTWRRGVERMAHSLLVWRFALVRSLGPRRAFA